LDNGSNTMVTSSATPSHSVVTSIECHSLRCSIILVDDEPAILALLTSQLANEFEVMAVRSADEARSIISRRSIDILLTDLHLADGTGLQLLDWVQRYSPQTARVLLSGMARIEDAADAINCCRIHRLVLKPWRAEDLLLSLRSVARTLLLERSHEQLLDEYRRLNLELEERVRTRTQELEQALRQLQMKNHLLEKIALTDALTGLPNRRAIELIARKELMRRTRQPNALSFVLIDADSFKLINSRYLLGGGDHVLTWLGQTLQSSIRATDAIGRIGGEEFMVVAPNTDTSGAEILAERLRASVESQHTSYLNQVIDVTVSIGVGVAPVGVTVMFEQLRELAAAALSHAKATGRNRFVIREATSGTSEWPA
jgi:diguanylate cyclase